MSIFRRRPRPNKRLLQETLAADAPPGAADIPLDVPLTGRSRAIAEAGSLLAVTTSLVLIQVFLGLGVDLFSVLLIAGHMLLLIASGWPDFSALNRRLRIAGEGVRLEKVHRAYTIPWWDVRSIQAKDDISTVRVESANRRITIDAGTLPLDTRKAIVHALRARVLPLGFDIEPWPQSGRILATARSIGFSMAGVVLLIASVFVVGPPQATALGIRCSVNSAFLQQTFGTPDQQGCVVLRVSAGAEKAGMRRGDLIIALGDIPVTSGTQFSILFEEQRRRSWTFTVIRSGSPEPLDFRVSPAPRREFKEDSGDPFFYYLQARGEAGDKPEEAIQDYSRVIELEPGFDLAYLYRAELYGSIGACDLAQQDYLKALELTPSLGEAHRIAGQIERRCGLPAVHFRIRKAIELDRCEGAFEHYNVDCAEDYFQLAVLQVNYVDLNEPIATAHQAIRFWPRAVQAYYVLATLYERLGDMATAAEYAQQYLEFPEDERFEESEANARRIRELAKLSPTPSPPAR